MLSKFKILPLLALGFLSIPPVEVNAQQIPLWSSTVCGWALSECRQDQLTPHYGKEICNPFNKKNQSYLCAGGNHETGWEACLASFKKSPPKDPCGEGYKVCMSHAFPKS
ncbi:MAG: hypothetical protein H0X26_03160 [Alphaproteobacteria bacterium]|nr:hypothetical protein [Alphaproteobacteria bacterium]